MTLSPGLRLRILGLLSVVVFGAPLLAPLVQGATVVEVVRLTRRGATSRLDRLLALLGALLGFLLFLATEYLWLV